MLDHVSITVSRVRDPFRFYESVMAALDHPCVVSEPEKLGFGVRNTSGDDHHTYISIVMRDGDIAADRRHWCFRAASRAAVDAFHAAGLANGGQDAGAPGLRPHYHPDYYAAFLCDPDGNRIEAVCHATV